MSWKKVAYLDEVATLSDNAPQDVDKSAASAGTGIAAARDDHKHDVSVAAPAAITEGASQAEGTSTSLSRADHVHASPSDWTPKTHATSHKDGGGDSIKLNEFANPDGAIEINKQALVNLVIDPQAAAPGTPVDGQTYFDTGDDHIYVYVA